MNYIENTYICLAAPLLLAILLLTPALGLLGTRWGVYDRKKALSKTCTAASLNTTPYRVTLDRDKWKGESAFCKEQGTVKGFGSQIQSPDGSLRIYRYFVPLILLTASLFLLSVYRPRTLRVSYGQEDTNIMNINMEQ